MAMIMKPGARWEVAAMKSWLDRVGPGNRARMIFLSGDYDPSLVVPAWAASTGFQYGSLIKPLTPNGHYYTLVEMVETLTTGTGVAEPTWPTDGSEVSDNDYTWRDSGILPNPQWYYSLRNFDGGGFAGVYVGVAPVDEWQPTFGYSAKGLTRKTANNGVCFICETSGTSGGSEPAWNETAGGITFDGTVKWISIGYQPGAFALPSSGTYDKFNGIELPNSNYEYDFQSGPSALSALVTDPVFSMDSVGWIGETVKYAVITSNPAGPKTVAGDEVINPVMVFIDLDTDFPSGFTIQSGGAGSFNITWPVADYNLGFGDIGMLMYTDHTL